MSDEILLSRIDTPAEQTVIEDCGEEGKEACGFDEDLHLPPSWAFGVLYGCYNSQAELETKVRRLIDEDYPIDAMWIDSCFWNINGGRGGYMNFTGDPVAYPDVPGMWKTFHDLHIKNGIWTMERIIDEEKRWFDEFDRPGWYREKVSNFKGHNPDQRMAVVIDFENRDAVARWKECMRPLMDAGADFFKTDAASWPPYVITHYELSLMSPRCKGRGIVLSHIRRGATPQQIKRYPLAWTGDSEPVWDARPDPKRYTTGGLLQQIEKLADPARLEYQYPFLTNDTGGFLAQCLGDEEQDELYQRWVQFSSLGPIMEVFGTRRKREQNVPYAYSEAAQENFRRHTHLRMQLFPYLYSLAHRIRHEGKRMSSGDGVHTDQFMMGEYLLAAPVYTPGARTREVYFPEGRWFQWWTGEAVEGGRTITVDAPRESLPLFVKDGAILPMRRYARAVELGSNDPLIVEIYPYGRSCFTLYEDDGESDAYLSGGFCATRMTCTAGESGKVVFEVAPSEGEYSAEICHRNMTLRFHNVECKPGLIMAGSEIVREDGGSDGWEYDRTQRLLSVHIHCETERGTVVSVE
jgi:alpha-glucosidase (family GH31 glycosyl hydrolase)